jgi:hypothetical protein
VERIDNKIMKSRIFFLFGFAVLGNACFFDNSSGIDDVSGPASGRTSGTSTGSATTSGYSTTTGSQGDTSNGGTGASSGLDTGSTGSETTSGTTSGDGVTNSGSTGVGTSSTSSTGGRDAGIGESSSSGSTGAMRDGGGITGSIGGNNGGNGGGSNGGSSSTGGSRDAGATGGRDAGTTSTGTTGSGGSDPLNAASKCTSNQKWSGANGLTMRPGENCVNCHTFTIAGTVFPSGHEPNDCNGQNGGINVVITDKNGKVTTLPINNVGNFETTAAIATPFTAKVVNTATGKERAMTSSQTVGACNSCHTQTGMNSAPGRITVPF